MGTKTGVNCKPTFIIAGAARSGTTSLYHWLKQHPQVFMSPVKETNYFANLRPPFTGPGDERLATPLHRKADGSFESRFAAIVASWQDYLTLFVGAETYAARGEVSPSYLYIRVQRLVSGNLCLMLASSLSFAILRTEPSHITRC